MHGTQEQTETALPSAVTSQGAHAPVAVCKDRAAGRASRPAKAAPATARDGACAPLRLSEIWSRPLLALDGKPATRFTIRMLLTLMGSRVRGITGLENIAARQDPFILCFNHGTRFEALLVPAVLAFLRGGRLVHFFADWNFRLIPVVGYIIRKGEPITVTRKLARPRVLNRLRPWFADTMPALERGRWWLERGESVAILPEGTVNRNPRELVRGDRGAAWLSLATGAPVVPAGIRFSELQEGQRVPELSKFELEFGRPMRPDASLAGRAGELSAVKEWHASVMGEISRLSHKTWNPQLRRRKHVYENHK